MNTRNSKEVLELARQQFGGIAAVPLEIQSARQRLSFSKEIEQKVEFRQQAFEVPVLDVETEETLEVADGLKIYDVSLRPIAGGGRMHAMAVVRLNAGMRIPFRISSDQQGNLFSGIVQEAWPLYKEENVDGQTKQVPDLDDNGRVKVGRRSALIFDNLDIRDFLGDVAVGAYQHLMNEMTGGDGKGDGGGNEMFDKQ